MRDLTEAKRALQELERHLDDVIVIERRIVAADGRVIKTIRHIARVQQRKEGK